MNIIETGLAFVEGLALIASPCILPVLPLILGASVDGGRRRPFGIIFGFVVAFTAFALLARHVVTLLDINLDVIKYGSLVLLALFGLVLISQTLSSKFTTLTQRFAHVGNSVIVNNKDGFFSGLVIGMLIGLVWTPCAGPILATVLVQIIRQESDLNALLLLASFALGAGTPMLLIALTGRRLMDRLGFLKKHAEGIRKGFGVIILLAVVFIATGANIPSASSQEPQAMMRRDTGGLQEALAAPYAAPDFTGIEAWLNSQPLTMSALRGKVVLIDFWTYSCINCIRTLPYVTQWDQAYRDDGLVIIGIHAPEFEFEKNKANVQNAIAKYNIEYPVALDNGLNTWTAFQNRYWPAHYLIDREGRVVYTHFGEGNYAQTENNIRFLLGLDGKTEATVESVATSRDQSPESYLGYERAANFLSPEALARDAVQSYTAPKFLPVDHWSLSGAWRVGKEHITATERGATLTYNFNAGKVFLVMGTQSGNPIKVKLQLNGEAIRQAAGKDVPDGVLTVEQHKLYELIDQGEVKNGLLEITAETPGLEAYAFTFGK